MMKPELQNWNKSGKPLHPKTFKNFNPIICHIIIYENYDTNIGMLEMDDLDLWYYFMILYYDSILWWNLRWNIMMKHYDLNLCDDGWWWWWNDVGWWCMKWCGFICHVCFEDILVPVAPYEEVSPAIIVLDFPGHFSGTKFPHNAQQLKSSSWAKLVHGCAPQVWYLGRVSGVLRDAKLIWLAQQPKYDEYIVPVIPDTSMPSSVGRTLAIDDRSWYRWILILGIMGSRWLSRLIIILQFRTEFHHLCNSITAQMRNRSREKHKQSPVSPYPPRTEPCPARPSWNAFAWKWCSGATWRSGKPCGPRASGPRESASWWLNARSTRHGVRLKWSCRPPRTKKKQSVCLERII